MKRSNKLILTSEDFSDIEISFSDEGTLQLCQDDTWVCVDGSDLDDFLKELTAYVAANRGIPA